MLKYRDAVEIVEAVPTCPPSLTTCAYGSGRPVCRPLYKYNTQIRFNVIFFFSPNKKIGWGLRMTVTFLEWQYFLSLIITLVR